MVLLGCPVRLELSVPLVHGAVAYARNDGKTRPMPHVRGYVMDCVVELTISVEVDNAQSLKAAADTVLAMFGTSNVVVDKMVAWSPSSQEVYKQG